MSRNRYYTGARTDHFDGTRFFNPNGVAPRGLLEFFRWQLATPSARWPKSFPSPHDNTAPKPLEPGAVRVTFIGHAAFLVQGAGHTILIDPVYADRASPFQFAGPRRVNPPGLAFDALPKIDAVIVTHNHYDHMDMPTLAKLWRRDRPQFITPLGNDTLLKRGIGAIEVTTMDWHQTTALGNAVTIDCVPAQHWSARGVGDRMRALWASFVLKIGRRLIYAVGDSGFGEVPTSATSAGGFLASIWRSCRSAPTSRAGSCKGPT